MSHCDVLALFAHPDDESLLSGGLLAACAATGRRVGLVSMTRGELGPIATAGLARDELGPERERELAAAAAELGAAWSLCLDMPDGELATIDRRGAVAAVDALLGDCEPAAVVTFAGEGLYWHPDHVAVYQIVHQAVVGAIPVYEMTWPHGHLAAVTAEARRRGLSGSLWGIEADVFGAPAEVIARELDVAPFLDAKLRALRCHRTQLEPGDLLSVLPVDLAETLLGREWLTAPPGGGDLADLVDRACAARAVT